MFSGLCVCAFVVNMRSKCDVSLKITRADVVEKREAVSCEVKRKEVFVSSARDKPVKDTQ